MNNEYKGLEIIKSQDPMHLIEGDYVNALARIPMIVGRHQPGQIPDFETYFKDEQIPEELLAQREDLIKRLNLAVKKINDCLRVLPDEQEKQTYTEWEHNLLESLQEAFYVIYGDEQGQYRYRTFLENNYKKLVEISKRKRNIPYVYDYPSI